jgi:hypothetical protein
MRRTSTAFVLALAALFAQTAATFAQTAPSAAPQGTSRAPAADGATQLARIKDAVNQPMTIRVDEDQLRFYVQIVVKPPSFAEYVKGQDLMTAPTKGGNPMTHQEFTRMMTPQGLFSR